jgi:hypothetical protein
VSDAPRNQFGEQQTGLNGFAKTDTVRKKETNASHADCAKYGHELVGLDAQATGLHRAEGVHAERLFQQEGLMISKPVWKRRGPVWAQIVSHGRDLIERSEQVHLLSGEVAFNSAQTMENLRA